MKVLVLAFYFPPDLSACAFRMKALLPVLADGMPAGSEIDVLTSQPNRYGSFSVDVPAEERHGPIRIRRIEVPGHQSGMLDQAWSFSMFARSVLKSTERERYDVVFATSSRLMTAVLGSVVARRQDAPLYLDIRDIFVDTMRDVLPGGLIWACDPILSWLERTALRRADHVNLVSKGFREYFQQRYPDQEYSFIPNGIDDEFVDAEWQPRSPEPRKPPWTVVYAGNMGQGQGLHRVIPSIAKGLEGEARFRIIGDGGKRDSLERVVRDAGLGNVEIIPPMDRDELLSEYRRANVLFLHLNDHDAFRRVLPSKIFEYAATGKPIWAGVAGYAADFLRTHVTNVEVFPPCDAAAALSGWRRLELVTRPRTEFIRTFSRRTTSVALADDVLRLLPACG